MFNIGDVVQLKSGGPFMTVTEAATRDGRPTVWCVWFDKTDQKNGHFPAAALEVVADEADD